MYLQITTDPNGHMLCQFSIAPFEFALCESKQTKQKK